MRDYPKFIVQWQTEFNDAMATPQQAGIEALRELAEDVRTGSIRMLRVFDVDDSRRDWLVGFYDHEFHCIAGREVKMPIDLPPVREWLR